MVVIGLPTAEETGLWQASVAVTLMITVHAPHKPTPQPYLVPVMSRVSRNTHSNGVSPSTSTLCGLVLMLRVIVAILCLPVSKSESEQLFGLSRLFIQLPESKCSMRMAK